MPYIKSKDRLQFTKILDQLPLMSKKGELEFCIFTLMTQYMEGRSHDYATLHEVVYAAIHCGDEFRRRNLDPREDYARTENGDIH
jgi:hypothetical protein